MLAVGPLGPQYSLQDYPAKLLLPHPAYPVTMAKNASPAKKVRSYKRLITFVLKKKPPILANKSLPQIDILPAVKVLSVSPQVNLSIFPQSRELSKTKPVLLEIPPELNHYSSGNVIPQLDGCSIYQEPQFKCDHCSTVLKTEELFRNHAETHERGCDECYFCFTSKHYADLHELGTHPGTLYALPTYLMKPN